MPTNETGAVAFQVAHPTWDGEGVTIGILDSGVDLAHPALQETTTGEPKIVDSFTATDPLTEGPLVGGGRRRPGARWSPRSADGPLTSRRRPQARTYTLAERHLQVQPLHGGEPNVAGGEVLGDVNRDGDTTDRWGVLYDPATNDIWVDSDGDQNFTNNPSDASVRARTSRAAPSAPTTPPPTVVEAMPFTVDFREDRLAGALRHRRGHGRLRRHRHRLRCARLARRRHHRRQQHVRRPDGRRGARRQARRGSGLLLRSRLQPRSR